METITGNTAILTMIGIGSIVFLYLFARKIVILMISRRKSQKTVMMLPSGTEHSHLLEGPAAMDFYSAPVTLRRTAAEQPR